MGDIEKSKPNLLVVDDDLELCALLRGVLSEEGYDVVTAYTGEQMHQLLTKQSFDLIILDVMLPTQDGFTLCRKLRETSAVPVIILSANGKEAYRVAGLEFGADDYLAKPFGVRELLARIRALLRRSGGQLARQRQMGDSIQLLSDICFDRWRIDRNKHLLLDESGMVVPLSSGEYDLLLALVEHPQRVLSRDQLLEITRGREAGPLDRTIDVQIGRLRKKLEQDPKQPRLIVTVRGGGYQFNGTVRLEAK